MKTLAVVLNTLALLVAGAAVSAGAYAKSSDFTHYRSRSFTVKYDDLDLSRRAGVVTLYHRLQGAAEEACGPVYQVHSLNPVADRRDWEACYRNALDSAAAKVDNRQLSQVINSHTGTVNG